MTNDGTPNPEQDPWALRRPTWDDWKSTERARLWQAVALACGWPYQHQRTFLIATQDLQENFSSRLLPKIGHRLNGTIRRIKETKALTDNH